MPPDRFALLRLTPIGHSYSVRKRNLRIIQMKKPLVASLALVHFAASVHAEDSTATRLLKERSEHLKPIISKVSESVYCASGYSPANISMIVGSEGLVIVDTGMFPDHAQAVLDEFRRI